MTTETYVVDEAGRPIITKDPNAVLDYTLNLTDYLAEIDDTIDQDPGSCVMVFEAGTELTETQSLITTDTTITCWLSGGTTINKKEGVTFRFTTVGGRIDDRTIYIKFKER